LNKSKEASKFARKSWNECEPAKKSSTVASKVSLATPKKWYFWGFDSQEQKLQILQSYEDKIALLSQEIQRLS